MQYSQPSPPVAATLTRNTQPDLRPIRTLIVDDEPFAQATLQMLLRPQPQFQVVGSARTGTDAVRAIRRLGPDLVLLDVDMPGLDGFEVLAQVQGADRPAVIFITGNATTACQAFDVGAIDFLVKPFTRTRFKTALARAQARLMAKAGAQQTLTGSQAVRDNP